MKYLSRSDIEAIAKRILTAYMKLPELSGQQIYRIAPELLIEKVLGLHIDYKYLSKDGSILGLTSFCEIGVEVFGNDEYESYCFLDGKTVLVDKRLKEDIAMKGRCNFTAVHEASHQIFKMLYPNDYGSDPKENKIHFYRSASEIKIPITDWEEWQANTLGSAILLPSELIHKAMNLFCLGEKIKMLNKIYAPKVYEQFTDMAEFLGASKSALAIRLKQLGLLEKDYLRNPYDLVNIYYEGGN